MEGRGGGDAAAPLNFKGVSTFPDHPRVQQLPGMQVETLAGDVDSRIQVVMDPQTTESVNPESPTPSSLPSVDVKDDTPKKQKQCNCKHSRCLKLYCECFASGIYCDGCNCNNCYNNVENDATHKEAVEATLERNPNAFRPKIASSPHGKRAVKEEIRDGVVLAKHNKGCNCKKSGCLKKYCECFEANILCSDNCKCMDCKNYEGSDARLALFHGDHANNIVHMQQVANAAIKGAVGSFGFGSPPFTKKRKCHEAHKVNSVKSPTSTAFMSSVPVTHSSSTAVASGHSKLTYRSLLADLIQPQDLAALCSVLVAMTTEAAKTFAEVNDDPSEPKLAAAGQNFSRISEDTHEQSAPPNYYSNAFQAVNELRVNDCGSTDTGLPTVRPMSPETLALMCDERDTSFMAAAPSLHQRVNETLQLPEGIGEPDLYFEQERLILTKLRDCLTRLISFGEIKETRCSNVARSASGCQSNETSSIVHGNGGIAKVPIQPSIRMSHPVTKSPSFTPNVVNQHLRSSLADENGVMISMPEK